MALIDYLPKEIRDFTNEEINKGLEEIRIRVGNSVELIPSGRRSKKLVNREMIDEILNYLTDYSLASYEEQLKAGFFTVEGGHRVGVAGRYDKNGMFDINSVNIRVAREEKGCSKGVITYIKKESGIHNTLIVSGPGIGKTTYLRDCIRILSHDYKVGIVDERSEIGAAYFGELQNDLGPKCDVMDNCGKSIGMKMLLRSMSPQIIAVDEIGDCEDYAAIEQIMNSGVYFIGTVHAYDLEQLKQKKYVWKLVENKIITRLIFLRVNAGERSFNVMNELGEVLC